MLLVLALASAIVSFPTGLHRTSNQFPMGTAEPASQQFKVDTFYVDTDVDINVPRDYSSDDIKSNRSAPKVAATAVNVDKLPEPSAKCRSSPNGGNQDAKLDAIIAPSSTLSSVELTQLQPDFKELPGLNVYAGQDLPVVEDPVNILVVDGEFNRDDSTDSRKIIAEPSASRE